MHVAIEKNLFVELIKVVLIYVSFNGKIKSHTASELKQQIFNKETTSKPIFVIFRRKNEIGSQNSLHFPRLRDPRLRRH